MKPKLILCLALVLSGGLFGCSANTPHSMTTVAQKSEHLYTREFQLNGDVFFANLDKQTNWKEKAQAAKAMARTNSFSFFGGQIQDAFNKFLADAGVNIQPPSSVFLNDYRGQVWVKGTQQECDAVKRIVEDLNGRQVTKAKQ